jgi:hypothetical protein
MTVGIKAYSLHGLVSGFVSGLAWRLVVAFALASPVALLGGCSAFTDPSYPAIHDMPAPRTDAPMSQDEVKRATSDLVTERDILNTEAQTTPDAAATGSTPAAGSPPAAGKAVNAPPAVAAKKQTSGARPNP